MLFFGTGTLVGVRTDLGVGVLATPVRFGDLQEISLDVKFSKKSLKGQKQFDLDTARTGGEISCKAKMARFSGKTIGDIFFNETVATGSRKMADLEAHTIPHDTSYVATTTYPVGHATAIVDLGVLRASDLAPFTRVTAPDATLEYSMVEATGVYTFDVADKDVPVLITYTYAQTTGVSFEMTNRTMGTAPYFQMFLQGSYEGNEMFVNLYRVSSGSINFSQKQEDYMVPECEFHPMDNGAYKIGYLSFSN
jgi:hypothetical protein